MSWEVRTLPGRYADSVRLMGVARALRARDGVAACEVAMGTPANLAALAELGAHAQAGPGDVVIAVDGRPGACAEALAEAQRLLEAGDQPAGGDGGSPAPRSLASAAARLGGANVAVVSVPGEYAVLEAHRALSRGLHVFLFSDHVGLDDEVELKRRAIASGLLMMGPECGTAILGGIGLGFANVVRRGPVGIVAAGGTGAQEAACLLDAAGSGVSQIIGVGGRDLSAAVGGVMFRAALALLARDPRTETLLLVSKPPDPRVARSVADALPAGRRAVAAFGGVRADTPLESHPTLEAATLAAAGAAPLDVAELERAVDAARARAAGRRVVGLYSGGSLAHEAMTVLAPKLGAIASTPEAAAGGHVVVDLGDERFTAGRPHPMVDVELRARLVDDAAGEAHTGCLLLDVVLGHGAHPDPAGELAPAVARAARRVLVIVRVCGTAADPQDADRQAATLREAGALVAPSNAAAARLAARAVAGGQP